MKELILQALRDVEREMDIRVLLAVESGSRAWGFASPDSDYDVRFIYAHSRDWYVSVSEERDVIERMLPHDLDVSGWELRKTLRLFAKCNLALNEWLDSPIRYLETPAFRGELLELLPGYFNPIAAIYHYRKMALAAFEGGYVEGSIGIKKIFYVLRPLLACRWIARTNTQPPTEFGRLLAAAWVQEDERSWIRGLLERKQGAKEAEKVLLEHDRAERIRGELDHFESLAQALPPST
jgi:predicted nucleotidyltransferase